MTRGSSPWILQEALHVRQCLEDQGLTVRVGAHDTTLDSLLHWNFA
jgi:hypothetical protein